MCASRCKTAAQAIFFRNRIGGVENFRRYHGSAEEASQFCDEMFGGEVLAEGHIPRKLAVDDDLARQIVRGIGMHVALDGLHVGAVPIDAGAGWNRAVRLQKTEDRQDVADRAVASDAMFASLGAI